MTYAAKTTSVLNSSVLRDSIRSTYKRNVGGFCSWEKNRQRNMFRPTPPSSLVILLFAASFLCMHARAQTGGVTPEGEVRALNSIFRKWKISSSMSEQPWNITNNNEPCTGSAITTDEKIEDDYTKFSPAIFCDCVNNTCHIIRLQVYGLNIVGTIPDELQDLKFLEVLQIGRNHLTGPLPSFIGNFTNMHYLSIGFNSLSGTLPKEIGLLKNLRNLGMGLGNNFSGPLPPEFGNLTNLETLYIDSAGLTGEIPETMGNLQRLKIMAASDNNFGGKVPGFIGKMTKLEELRIEGNSFQGPIPPSFGNLVQLQHLRLGDLSKVISSLKFIKNMKNLTFLTLRDCMINDVIPSDIGEYKELKYLDLSFNNISGQLPPSLVNLGKLQTLYLGNNSLSGELPEKKSTTLLHFDLSYNQFNGMLPKWVGDNNLHLNLVANYFTESSDSVLPWGLRCLQRDIPCGKGSPNYFSFAINCGGSESMTYDGRQYEIDNISLLTSSYHVTRTQRWATSGVGTFFDRQDTSTLGYISDTTENIGGTTRTKLFQSVRMSPSSLRYYGLRLENGKYTVQLLFAEIAYPNDKTWKSLGRRLFNIYIQGVLVEKDFDIRKEAGRSFKAIEKNYTTTVTENFLEVHFYWAGKGTCCIPIQGVYGPLISAISVTPEFKPTVSNQPPDFDSADKSKVGLTVGLTVGLAVFFFILFLGICIWRHKKRHHNMDDEEILGLDIVPNSYSYEELKNATQDFSAANKLGEGGFGPVFKGKLSDDTNIAVKKLSTSSLQGKSQFVTEVATISAVKHRNLVKLYGCCYEGNKRLLVYEYLEKKSLDQALFGKSDLLLDWPARYMICLGTAKGLAYLHEESRVRLIHRDIKAGNILLDDELQPKISDFGLAKLYDEKMTHISTRVAGTVGYLAPEYAMRGHLTEKADVFSFGVVTLEILCGRRNTSQDFDKEQNMCLLEWAWELHENGQDMEMLDKAITSFKEEEVLRMIGLAFLCTQLNPLLRPSMSHVASVLEGDAELGDIPSNPPYLSNWLFDELDDLTGGSGSTDTLRGHTVPLLER